MRYQKVVALWTEREELLKPLLGVVDGIDVHSLMAFDYNDSFS